MCDVICFFAWLFGQRPLWPPNSLIFAYKEYISGAYNTRSDGAVQGQTKTIITVGGKEQPMGGDTYIMGGSGS